MIPYAAWFSVWILLIVSWIFLACPLPMGIGMVVLSVLMCVGIKCGVLDY
jgi:hypothetical protein